MELDLGYCVIRSWRFEDQKSLVRHADDRDVWINLRDIFPHPYTPKAARDWLEFVNVMKPELDFAIAVEGSAVGGVGLVLHDDVERHSAEIGYWLGQSYWGRGIATAVVRAMTEWAFTHLDVCRIYAAVFEWNPASARVLEKSGYQFEGRLRRSVTKDGKTIDQLLYANTRPRD
ncbi:GNAT family N-acetyltransferase [Singulisphaera rosea]